MRGDVAVTEADARRESLSHQQKHASFIDQRPRLSTPGVSDVDVDGRSSLTAVTTALNTRSPTERSIVCPSAVSDVFQSTACLASLLTRCGLTDYLRAVRDDVDFTDDLDELLNLVRRTAVEFNTDSQTSSRRPALDRLVCRCLGTVRAAMSHCDDAITDDGVISGVDVADDVIAFTDVMQRILAELNSEKSSDKGTTMKLIGYIIACFVVVMETRRFDALMTSVCADVDDDDQHAMNLLVLEAVLEADCRLANRNLLFGDTPLVRATRTRNPDVIVVLLRHGADVQRPCEPLDAVATLLFSPNLVVAPRERDVDHCLRLLLAGIPRIPVDRLRLLDETGSYYPLCSEPWQTLVARVWNDDLISRSTKILPVASLQHLACCSVRDSVCNAARHRPTHSVASIPWSVQQLLLPRVLKNAILFDHADFSR